MSDDAIARHELRVFFDAKIPICGCGSPEAGVALIYEVLKLHPLYEHRDELRALLPTEGIEMVVLGLLDGARLNEHGGGIGGSWLTPLGKRILAALQRELDAHPDDEEPFESFCDHSCVHGYFFDQGESHDCLTSPDPIVPAEESYA